jgi:hypothetical protein
MLVAECVTCVNWFVEETDFSKVSLSGTTCCIRTLKRNREENERNNKRRKIRKVKERAEGLKYEKNSRKKRN